MPSKRVETATRKALKAAEGQLRDIDAGAAAVLVELARQIDVMADNNGLREDGKLDNVSVPTYLRYCESLGLTPAGRTKLPQGKKETGGRLAQLRAVQADRRGA